MTPRRIILVTVLLVGVAGGALLFTPPVQRHLRTNRVLYLRNAHAYAEALESFRELKRRVPELPRNLQAFERETVEHASAYFLRDGGMLSDADRARYAAFQAAVREEGDLAALGRRLELQLAARRDGPSTATLAAARAVLERDGYDLEALWWAVRSQYDPCRPLTLPAELVAWRDPLEARAPFDPLHPDRQPSAQQQQRKVYLMALLALADRDWASAAARFEEYARLDSREEEARSTAGDELPQALALLRSGQPAAAAYLLQREASEPTAAALLVEAWLALGEPDRAAMRYDAARAIDAAGAERLLTEYLGLAAAAGNDPLLTLAHSNLRTHADGLMLWRFAERASDGDSPAARALAQTAAGWLEPGASETEAIQIAQFALQRDQPELARRAAAAVRSVPLGRSLQRLIASRADGATSGPRVAQDLSLLLTRNATRHFDLNLPPEAELVVINLQGYPADGVWPLVHVELESLGGVAHYARDSRARAQPLLIRPRRIGPATPGPRPVTVSVSLLNGDDAGRRNVMVSGAQVF
ncbi:MAG TPA: hypothetical protein PLS90_03900 [Candidatus Sumerlaeota bacterium]|nr:hypothetical protein [Candidatus Sumerlaeota bacterium]HOR27374.1 hypothetical protein [Candidatus Sumerlaeota bacterium]HPK01580.1 hypothetical protein [Candidatus Sumerlaeota bacterium]